MFDEYFMTLAKKSRENNPIRKTDYLNSKGLFVCGICGKPRESSYKLFNGKTIYVRCTCDCDEKAVAEEQKEKARQQRLSRISELKNNGDADKKLLKNTFDEDMFSNSENSKRFRKYVDVWRDVKDKNYGLLFTGGTGTGKSFYASCIANAIIDKYVDPVIATTMPKIINKLQSLEDKNKYLEELSNVPLLLIDDFGVESESEFRLEQIFNVINDRVNSRNPMIITTNLTSYDLLNPKDIKFARIYDRILANTVQFEFKGENLRNRETIKKQKELMDLLNDEEKLWENV
jgi:DNA replication protein DnaC